MICIGSVAAAEDNNVTDDSLALEISDESDISINQEEANVNGDELGISNDSVLSEPQTIVVEEVELNHNEMGSSGTIQKAINSANAGDTIVINGRSYVHCHFVIDKQLTIISNVGTTMEVCPGNTAGSNHFGIFYVSPEASGTVIEGFSLTTDVSSDDDYGILVKGAENVIIRNCNVSNTGSSDAIRIEDAKNTLIANVTVGDAVNGIRIKNSNGVNVRDSLIKNSKYGVYIVGSNQTTVDSNNITNNNIAGIAVGENNNCTTAIYNNVTYNKAGINITSADNVYILSNYIAYSTNGVYINCNVTKIEIRGNFFNQNKGYEVLNDHRVKNLIDPKNSRIGYPDLEIIDNNYMIGLIGAEEERPVYRIVYNYVGGNRGAYSYDAANDVYNYVGDGKGSYAQAKGAVFMRYVFEINKNVNCPVIYYDYSSGTSWSLSGNYELQLSEITQVKKGVYSISIVDEKGTVASDLSSVPVTFYLNKDSTSSTPKEGDTYKTVMMKNGTATARFYVDDFAAAGNVITAVVPTPGSIIDGKVSKTFNVDDSNIPGSVSETSLTVNDLSTYPNSNEYVTAKLTDESGNPVSGAILTFTINSVSTNMTTDGNGQANFKVSVSKEGTYDLNVIFGGDDGDYESSDAHSQVTVKKTAVKLSSSNVYMIPKMAEYYSVTLKDDSGNPVANQKITFKINGKTYNKKTNSKGVAKVQLKFSKNKKTYKITANFAGTNQYKAISKTNKITVKYSSKTAKLNAPTVNIPPKTSKYYTVTLKDANGKGISKQKVAVKINGKTYNKKTNSKGQVKIKVKFSKIKTYKVSATYKGSKIYKKASSSGKIKVAKTTTKITAPTVSILPKESKTYTVTLKANNKALSKQKLTIKLNGKTYTKTTNSKGKASVSVKFSEEKNYKVNVNYKGTGIYKASKASGKIIVSKLSTQIESYDKTYSKDLSKDFSITLKDANGNGVANEIVTFEYGGSKSTTNTDSNGRATLTLSSDLTSFDVTTTYGGSEKYNSASAINKITVLDKTGVVFVDEALSSSEIQYILDNSDAASNIEFLGASYSDIGLTVNKNLNIYSSGNSVLNAADDKPVFNIKSDNVNISDFTINAFEGNAVEINNAKNVEIINNIISNALNQSKMESYENGSLNLPGYGICISNSSDVNVIDNVIDLFESSIFAQYSSKLNICNNTLSKSNYGVKFGFGVANTEIANNLITNLTGLYIMTVPEGPSGYGIYLNNSAVNVTINQNTIVYNHLGISLDANKSTGIVITQNLITDNVLEGIRFNAGYDLAENAVEPYVTDNAIYRNARGPSMMILGELSANPEGIYGNGLYVDADKLQLDANWYGTNQIVTWDFETGVVGYGTMCPRINTTEIKFNNFTYNSPGNYSIVFYKNGNVASNLPKFNLYATLNRGTEKAAEVIFDVVDGVGTFTFDSSNFNDGNNTIEISVGSLIYSTSRVFKVTASYEVPESEIPK